MIHSVSQPIAVAWDSCLFENIIVAHMKYMVLKLFEAGLGSSVSTIIFSEVAVAPFRRVCYCVLVCVKKERHRKQMLSTTTKMVQEHKKIAKGGQHELRNALIHLGLQSSHRCLLQPTVIVPHAHWEAYGRGILPLHNLVSDSANPHYVSDPLPQSFVGSS